MMPYDLVVVGAGPAGTTAAALASQAGLRTLIIERAQFPRDKVCGDCVNPGCWDVFGALGVSAAIARLPHSRPRHVHFVDLRGGRLSLSISDSECGEIAVRRRELDQLLLNRAIELGAEFWSGEPVIGLQPGWIIETRRTFVKAKYLVAADGRNSTVARLLGHGPPSRRDRVALQTHFPWKAGPHIGLEINRLGYLGRATVSDNEMNLCLVCRPPDVGEFRAWAEHRFNLSNDHHWSTIAPLARAPIRSVSARLFYVGDAGRVVEPFTGEGILYALRTGQLVARAIVEDGRDGISAETRYRRESESVYRGRLWINRLAKQAVLQPGVGDTLLRVFHRHPTALRQLTARVLGLDLRTAGVQTAETLPAEECAANINTF
jgi:flavin-dependent dehydrogenase